MPYYDGENRKFSPSSATAYNGAVWTFSGNNTQQPLLSGPVTGSGTVGHQPMLFDTLAGVYNRCHVGGSKISVDCHPVSNTNAGAWAVYLYPNNSSTHIYTTLGNLSTMREVDKMKYKVIPNIYTGNAKDRIVKTYRSTKSMYQGDTTGRDFQNSSSSPPTYQWYWNLMIVPEDQSSAYNAENYVDIKLTYYCEWSELLPTGGS